MKKVSRKSSQPYSLNRIKVLQEMIAVKKGVPDL
jgi:hypothetical protein